MFEQFPRAHQEEETPKDVMAEVIEKQEVGGISAALEKIYNQTNIAEAIKSPEYEEVSELVEDFQNKVSHKDGSRLPVSEAVGVLRIIAKEQKWNEDHWSFDVIRKEAEKMGYVVTKAETGSAYQQKAA